ncbi:hypothetical protein N9W31_00700 [Litoricolaceae bacterium]|nr:hypothetical protein [Litorivicinaceae bacterium]
MTRNAVFVVNKFPDIQHACFFYKNLFRRCVDSAVFFGITGDHCGHLVDDFFRSERDFNASYVSRASLLFGKCKLFYGRIKFYRLSTYIEKWWFRILLRRNFKSIIQKSDFIFIDYTVASMITRMPDISSLSQVIRSISKQVIVLPHAVPMFRESPRFYKPIGESFRNLPSNYVFVVHSEAQKKNLRTINRECIACRSEWLDNFMSWGEGQATHLLSSPAKICLAMPGVPRNLEIEESFVDFVMSLGFEVFIVGHPRLDGSSGFRSVRFDESPSLNNLRRCDVLICGVSAFQLYAYALGIPVLIAKELMVPPDFVWCESQIAKPPEVEREQLIGYLRRLDELKVQALERQGQVSKFNARHPRLDEALKLNGYL